MSNLSTPTESPYFALGFWHAHKNTFVVCIGAVDPTLVRTIPVPPIVVPFLIVLSADPFGHRLLLVVFLCPTCTLLIDYESHINLLRI
jgi:hypothetical protein